MNKRILTLLLILGVIIASSGCIETVRNGEHSGQVTAIEKEGIIWKTWTVYVKSDVTASEEDTYCVEDPALVGQLVSASELRNKITVHYRDELIVAPWRCGIYNGGIITGIEVK